MDKLLLTVTDVKNYIYCPRVVYYHYFLPIRPATFKMEEGKRAGERTEELEERRSLRAYGLRDGERHFNIDLQSSRLALIGKLDMAITQRHEVIPVEFKNTYSRPGLNHKYQLTAYALLCEEHFQKPARRGFIYLIPTKKPVEIPFTPETRRFTVQLLNRIRRMLDREQIPPPTRSRGRCRDCEFRRWCWDLD